MKKTILSLAFVAALMVSCKGEEKKADETGAVADTTAVETPAPAATDTTAVDTTAAKAEEPAKDGAAAKAEEPAKEEAKK